MYIYESCDFPPFVTTGNIRKGFVTAKSLFLYNKKRISLYFFNIKTRFWPLRRLPCHFGLLQMGANHNFHKCTTFPEKKCRVIPVLRSQKVGFCHKKLLFVVVTNAFIPLRGPSMLFYAVTSGANFIWHPNNSFSTINILVAPPIEHKKSTFLLSKTDF